MLIASNSKQAIEQHKFTEDLARSSVFARSYGVMQDPNAAGSDVKL
jgi:hypothetical protein